MRLYYQDRYTEMLDLTGFNDTCIPNINEIETVLKDLRDFSKKPKLLKGLQLLCEHEGRANKVLSSEVHFRHMVQDFGEIVIPRRTADFPRSFLRLLALEKS